MYVWVPKVMCGFQGSGMVHKAVVRYRVVSSNRGKVKVSPYKAERTTTSDVQSYLTELCFSDKADAERKCEELAKEVVTKLERLIDSLLKGEISTSDLTGL